MSLTVLLSLAVGLATYEISIMNGVEDSRVLAMTSDQFIAIVKKHKDPVYWLGPVPRNKYSFNHVSDSVDIVSYVPKGSSLSNVNQRKMTVKTYRTLVAYRTHIHPLVGADTLKFVTSKGVTVKFSEDQMDIETVTLSGRPEIVVIRYPTMQTAEALIKNADSLRLLK